MASDAYEALVELGPFKGINYTKADPSVEPGFGVDAVNANTSIVTEALLAEFGREQIFNFTAPGLLNSISVVFPFTIGALGSNAIPAYLVGGLNPAGAFALYIYVPIAGTPVAQVSYVGNALPFDQAVQFSGVVYTNGGQRLFASSLIGTFLLATSGTAVPGPGTYTITPSLMGGIFPGAVLQVDTGSATITETIVVSSTTATTFTANFARAHSGGFEIFQTALFAYMFAWQYPPPTAYGNITLSPAGAYSTGAVNAATTAPITTTGLVTITPTNMTNIANGITIALDSGAQQELLVVSGVTGSTFQVTIKLAHDTGATILGGIGAETVYYVITCVTTMPDGTTSETSVDLNQYATPPTGVNGSMAGTFTLTPINGLTWSGISALDGLPFTTNLYRQSSLQPTYQLVANLTGSGAFTDISPDLAIAGNVQLQPQRDQPPSVMGSYGVPAGAANYGSLAVHKGRVWWYGNVQTSSTNNFPQNQLWYSNLGRPWEFNQLTQVLLMQSAEANQYAIPPNYNTTYDDLYGDDPLAIGEVGSLLMAHARREAWAVYGDAPSSFLNRILFNIGIVSRHSLACFNGGEAWLSENGPYWFDGSSPQYISEAFRGVFKGPDGLTPAQMSTACSAYSGLTWYLSFPALNITYGYFTVDGIWLGSLPYAPSSAASFAFVQSNPNYTPSGGNAPGINEVVAARFLPTGGAALDAWFVNSAGDLGVTTTASWTGPFTRSKAPRNEKQYTVLTLDLPPGQFGKAVVTLQIDDKAPITWTIPDLSQSTRFIKTIGTPGQGTIPRGFMAQLSIELTGLFPNPSPEVWGVTAWGIKPLDRTLTPRV